MPTLGEPEPVKVVTPKSDRKLSLDELRELMANPKGERSVDVSDTFKAIAETESPLFWQGWSEELSTLENGEIITYREHLKTRKRREIRRESSLESA